MFEILEQLGRYPGIRYLKMTRKVFKILKLWLNFTKVVKNDKIYIKLCKIS